MTPNLDLLARECAIYEAARSVAPLTLPAHASMLTGLVPPRHGLRDNGLAALPSAARTLAEEARAAGLRTAAFVSAVVLDRAFGLDQGFEVYDAPPRSGEQTTSAYAERPAEDTAAAALQWLAAHGSEPHFLWVHFFDPHLPRRPTEAFLRQAGGAAYLAEVAAMDAEVGRLVRALRARGLLERALLVVVGDHGESLGQHGEPTHSSFVYDSTLRVPFLVRHPDGWRAGERSQEIASVVDVFPTALEWLGRPPPVDGDGVSLCRREVPPERGAYFESYYGYLNFGWSPLAGWVDRGGKYVHSSEPELYDLRADPREARDVVRERPEAAARARERIRAAAGRPGLDQNAPPRSTGGAIDPALGLDLERLGYASAARPREGLPHPLETGGRPAPRARAAELRSFFEALQLGDQGRLDEACERLEAILQGNAAHTVARSYLATYRVFQRRFAEAAELLEPLVAQGTARANDLNNLGYCREQLGDGMRALELYRRALELDPAHAWARKNLARLGGPAPGR